MNKMLNASATSMSYHHHHNGGGGGKYSSGSSTSSPLAINHHRRSIRNHNENDDYYYHQADMIGSDYFVSSLDFEYDLFLNGLVNGDNSGYRNRIRQQQHHKDFYEFPLINSSSHHHHHHHHGNKKASNSNSNSTSPSSAFSILATTDSLFAALNSPLSKAATAYRHLQRPSASSAHHQQQQQQQQQRAVFNDYVSLPSFSKSSSSSSTSTTTTTTTTASSSCSHNQSSQSNQINHSPIPLGTSLASNKLTHHSVINGYASTIATTTTTTTTTSATNSSILDQQPPLSTSPVGGGSVDLTGSDETDVPVDNLSHQQLHALHRFRQQRKKGLIGRLRDVVIRFTPKSRCSLVDRDDIYSRFGKEEQETLASFNYLMTIEDVDVGGGVNEPSPTSTTGEESAQVTELLSNDELIDLKMEEYDLINPFQHCDTTRHHSVDDDDADVDDYAEYENEDSGNQSKRSQSVNDDTTNTNKDDDGGGGSRIPNPKSAINSGERRFHSNSPPPLPASPASNESIIMETPSKSHSNVGNKLPRFRFGFPRKSSSLEFQSTIKRLDGKECSIAGDATNSAAGVDDDESISGSFHSHSVQETLTNNSVDHKSLVLGNNNNHTNIGSKYFLAKNSNSNFKSCSNSNSSATNNNSNNKKKNRNKKKLNKNNIITTITTST